MTSRCLHRVGALASVRALVLPADADMAASFFSRTRIPAPYSPRCGNWARVCRVGLATVVVGAVTGSLLACAPKDGKADKSKAGAKEAKPANRISEIGRIAGDSDAWPLEEPQSRDDETPSPVVGQHHVQEPVTFSFDYVQLVPAELALAESAPGVTPETSTIFDFVANAQWGAYGLWLSERGGRPTVTFDTLTRADGSSIPVTGQCGDLGRDRSPDPSKLLEPAFDTIHGCAAIKTEGEPLTSLKGHIDIEFTPERIGYRIDKPEVGDVVEGPSLKLTVEEVGERKIGYSLDGDKTNFWNVVGLDENGKGSRMTMVSTLEGRTTITWASMPVALRVEFASAPKGSGGEGAQCNESGRCSRRVEFEIPFSGLERAGAAGDPKAPAVSGATLGTAPDDWFSSFEAKIGETQAASFTRVDEGFVVLRAIQAAAWLAPLFELWTPPQTGTHTTFGGVQWHVSKVTLDKDSRRAPAGQWNAYSYAAPFLYDREITASVGRVDLDEVSKFVSQGSESATVKTVEGEMTLRSLQGETKTEVLPLAKLGTWSTGEGVQGRVIRVSTRDAQIELRGELDRVAGVVLRDKEGAVVEAPRIFRGGGCMMPVVAGSTMHLCFATARHPVASVELVTGTFKAGKKQKFTLELD